MSASENNPQFYCPLTDQFITIGEADLLVINRRAKKDLPKAGEPVAQANIVLRRSLEQENEEIEEICLYFWNETEFTCFGQTFPIFDCTNILALAEDEIAGLVACKKVNDELIIVVLNVYPDFQGQGIGRMLVKEALALGKKQGCTSVKVATTNDDLPALCLYQKMGFRLTELLPGVLLHHHDAELKGFAGLPVRDELRLERPL
ncbi:MAG: GNAT family N-acetyltransferase [bacterium]